ncbi:barstar family protein [Allosalinactinospora lopnorensis]|uniref:barstar family protein n=1 Tax=Allosalinactinospora lopnorensis TaxID=1352348 RepID=UPI0006979415|nr:barstar family protein [Allosalinactinospora lopnorensis]
MSQKEIRELFTRPEAPWAVVADETLAVDELREELSVTRGIAWVDLDGAEMTRYESLMAAFQTKFEIPDYFGHNWPALDETLADLEWFPAEGYVAHVRNAHMVLQDHTEYGLHVFYRLMGRVSEEWSVPVEVGEYWDRGPVPFHWLLTCPKDARQGVVDLFREAEAEAPRVLDT